MIAILKQYTHLNNEEFAVIVRLCLKYSGGEEITEQDGTPQQLLFFNNNPKPQIDKLIKARKRMERNRKK